MAIALRRRISHTFHHKSKPPHFPPPTPHRNNNNSPQKNNWTIPVGKNKEKLARPSITVNFTGTEPKYKTNPKTSKIQDQWLKKHAEATEKKNNAVFEKALFILSQSPTGRDLLERMTKAGYEIVFDERRTKPIGAGGLCDPANKKIVLGQTNDPEYLALVLGHEAVHALQYTTNNIFPNSSHTPQTAIRLSFAIEADAYAQQTQIALELKHGDPSGPKNQVKLSGPLHQMRKRFKNIVEAAEKTLTKKENLTNGAAVAAAFEGFFDNTLLRSFYEDSHMNWSNSVAPQIIERFKGLKDNFSNDGCSPSDITERLKHKGQPYLKQHAPNIDLDSPRHSGVTKTTQDKIMAFYKTYKPKDAPPKIKNYGKHIDNAAAIIFGRDASTNVIILKNQGRKPPPRPRGPKV